MKHIILVFALFLSSLTVLADEILTESFEYGNQDLVEPIGWYCDDNSWLCGHFDKDHNRCAHHGDWYVFAESDDAWMFMPLPIIEDIHYNISLWAITDGCFDLEVKIGAFANPESMSLDFIPLTEINSDEYVNYTATYVCETPDMAYIGIHCVRGEGASYLSLDDIVVEMVNQYDFIVKELTTETIEMQPGSTEHFSFMARNTGYDDETLVISYSQEYFSSASFFIDGEQVSRFDLPVATNVVVDVEATLKEDLPLGNVVFLDVMVGSTHNCHTGMASFFVIPTDLDGLEENDVLFDVYPNPTSDVIHIKADNLQEVRLFDLNGCRLLQSSENTIEISHLVSGLYLLEIVNSDSSRRIVKLEKL